MKKYYSISILTLLSIILTLILGSFIASARFISRSEWGADESLRLYNEDNPPAKLVTLPADFYIRFAKETKLFKIISKSVDGEDLTWPLQYTENVSKIVIHHTGSSKNMDDPKKAIQNIYYFHAITRGWGDIGYNYIIDQNGEIYEGRYGGDGVVGAHAGPGNRGSIGIAILGNYNENELTEESYNTLVKLISEKTKKYNIDPEGVSYFRGEKIPNIIGHRDLMATSCPGENIYKLFPQIRKDVAKLNGNYPYKKEDNNEKKAYAFEYISTQDEIIINPDDEKDYSIKLRNTGTQTWRKQTRLAYIPDSIVKRGFSIKISGLKENSVKPGEVGTFPISLKSKLEGGFYYLNFRFLPNGENETDEVLSIPSIINKPVFAYELVNISIPSSSIKSGEKILGMVALKNTGNVSWRNYGINRISLGTDNPRDRISVFTKSTRMGYLKESIVNPGETGHFIFNLKAPTRPGLYEEYFSPVIESVTWLDGYGMKFDLNVLTNNIAKK